jgi:4-amino-4-deoxy-L-arabinose transferase-like glycosyltransferase
MAQVVEHLPSKHKALSLIPGTVKKKKKKKYNVIKVYILSCTSLFVVFSQDGKADAVLIVCLYTSMLASSYDKE